LAAQQNPFRPSRLYTIRGDRYAYQLQTWPMPPKVPFLYLRGYWIEREAGFGIGQRVQIQVADQRIVIVPAPSSHGPENPLAHRICQPPGNFV